MAVDFRGPQKAYRPGGRVYEDLMYYKGPAVALSGPAGTGKSRGVLEKLHLVLEKYDGSRVLVFRKTRESLSEAALFTYETLVLPQGHPALGEGGQRRNRQSYRYPNGSELHVVGMDKPEKVMSTEYDIAYCQEATECEKEEVEAVSTRLRNGVVPYQQLIMDMNPSYPQHWIRRAALAGKLPMWETTHHDNPVLFESAPPGAEQGGEWPVVAPDGRLGRWTRRGAEYIARLGELTGARKERLLHGKWAAAEGAVYKNWSEPGHCAPWRRLPQEWKRVWAVDFGYTHPFVWGQWAVDGDGRAWLELEIYRTELLVRDAAEEILQRVGWRRSAGGLEPLPWAYPWPSDVVCDWDAEGRATLEDALGVRTTPAVKAVAEGVQAVEARLAPAGDGVPRLLFLTGALEACNGRGPDRSLTEAHKPSRTVEEFDGYVWDTGAHGRGLRNGVERPLGVNDHGMDMVKYLVAHLDGVLGDRRAQDVAPGWAESCAPVGVPMVQAPGAGSADQWAWLRGG